MSVPPAIDSEKLLEHATWVRGLARSLVADPHLADDLAQETYAAAFERPPAHATNVRGWLAAVLRNFHRQSLRGEVRRIAREERASRPEAEPSALDVLERMALHRELVEAVMELDEPFRTAILLRFFDGLAPRKIASQLRVPVATVHSRVQRGLAELRRRLSHHRGGDTRAWVLALLPLAKQAGPWTPGIVGPPLGALLMDVKAKVAIGAVLVACGVLGVWTLVRPAASPNRELAAAAPANPSRPAGVNSDASVVAPASDEPIDRVAAGGALEPAVESDPTPAAPPAARVRGRVLDLHAAPMATVPIVYEGSSAQPGDAITLSDRAGAFELAAPEGQATLVANDPRLATVMSGVWQPGSNLEVVVVVAETRTLAGTVVDENGAPLAGATISAELAAGFESRFARVLDASRQRGCSSTSDERGTFTLACAPVDDGVRIVTSLAGFLPDARPAPDFADSALEIVLRRPPPPAENSIAGYVVGPRGEPIEDARVALGDRVISTDSAGHFAFEPLADDPSETLTALKHGFLPAELRAVPGSASDARRWPPVITLRLGGAPRTLAGEVVDEQGKPLAGIRVWLADATFLGLFGREPMHVERVLGSAGPPQRWSWIESDEHGRYEIEGLLDRSYTLFAMDMRTLVQATAGPFAAGRSDAKIVLPAHAVRALSGRVVAASGQPLAGVQVQLMRDVGTVIHNGSVWSSRIPGATSLTDEQGRFELAQVPRGPVTLWLTGDFVVSEKREQKEGGDIDDLELVATARLHFQIELDAPVDRADQFCVLDERGQRLPILRIRGGSLWSRDEVELTDGRTPAVAVSEEARTLVLLRGDVEVERHPLALQPGALNTLRY